MKTINILVAAMMIFFLSNCSQALLKSVAYKDIYKEKPKSILIMPPINKTTNVECKEYFHSTLCVPFANKGYYIVPPFLSMEILRKESAYDSELFLKSDISKFGEIFGADAALFTIIHKWNKSSIGMSVTVEVEYILRSTKTKEILYTRRGTVVYDASSNSSSSLLANVAVSLIKTAATDYVMVARKVNDYTLSDLPAGVYHPKFNLDDKEYAGSKTFRATVR